VSQQFIIMDSNNEWRDLFEPRHIRSGSTMK
jgi:hypothetical protein